MDIRRLLRRKFEYFRPTPVHPGHIYVDQVTGETVTVDSVGPNVTLVRHDAEMNQSVSAPKHTIRRAIESDLLVHDEQRCSECR